MKTCLAVTMLLGFLPVGVRAQVVGAAIGELIQQSGAKGLPEVVAVQAVQASPNTETEHKEELLRFAQCSGVLNGVPITLEFLRESSAGRAGDQGLMWLRAQNGFEVPHRISIVADDERGTQVQLFAVFDPTVKFAEFTIPKTRKSKVAIYAIHFHANWATVDCTR